MRGIVAGPHPRPLPLGIVEQTAMFNSPEGGEFSFSGGGWDLGDGDYFARILIPPQAGCASRTDNTASSSSGGVRAGPRIGRRE